MWDTKMVQQHRNHQDICILNPTDKVVWGSMCPKKHHTDHQDTRQGHRRDKLDQMDSPAEWCDNCCQDNEWVLQMGIAWEENNQKEQPHKIHQGKVEAYPSYRRLESGICRGIGWLYLGTAHNYHHCNDNRDKQVVQDIVEQNLCRNHQGTSLED
jgi:hypothetical protein